MDTDMEAKRGKEEITDLVLPRFLRYLAYWTTSDPQEEATPSSPGQWDLAKALVQELKDLGVAEVALTAYCYVIARLPPTPGKEAAETVGFLAHLDTAPDVSGKDVRPCVVEAYDGSPIALAGGLVLDPALDPDLASLRGQTLVHTDGTTLLGADDKAGIAVLMGVVAYLAAHPEVEHGPVEIIFTPDEETGKGLPEFPGKDLKARICYTLDGGALGEVESECFNAYRAEIQCTGAPVHLGYARGRLVNAALMAASFALMLPRSESPEATDGYYGYYGLTAIQGTLEAASLEVFIRDFDRTGAARRLEALERFARAVEAQFPGGRITVKTQVQYYNMKEKIHSRPEVLEVLQQAVAHTGLQCRMKPIRGGTDGSRLTELGIPCPNIFTGGRNWHSPREWLSVPDMTAACEVVLELIRLWGARPGSGG